MALQEREWGKQMTLHFARFVAMVMATASGRIQPADGGLQESPERGPTIAARGGIR